MDKPQFSHALDIWSLFDYLSYIETGTKDNWTDYSAKYLSGGESISYMSPENRFTLFLLICESENI